VPLCAALTLHTACLWTLCAAMCHTHTAHCMSVDYEVSVWGACT